MALNFSSLLRYCIWESLFCTGKGSRRASFAIADLLRMTYKGYHESYKEDSIFFIASLQVFVHAHNHPLELDRPALPASPHRITASVPLLLSWPFVGLFPVFPHLFCTGRHRTGPSTPDVASPVLNKGKGSPLFICCWCFPKMQPGMLLVIPAAAWPAAAVSTGTHRPSAAQQHISLDVHTYGFLLHPAGWADP